MHVCCIAWLASEEVCLLEQQLLWNTLASQSRTHWTHISMFTAMRIRDS